MCNIQRRYLTRKDPSINIMYFLPLKVFLHCILVFFLISNTWSNLLFNIVNPVRPLEWASHLFSIKGKHQVCSVHTNINVLWSALLGSSISILHGTKLVHLYLYYSFHLCMLYFRCLHSTGVGSFILSRAIYIFTTSLKSHTKLLHTKILNTYITNLSNVTVWTACL